MWERERRSPLTSRSISKRTHTSFKCTYRSIIFFSSSSPLFFSFSRPAGFLFLSCFSFYNYFFFVFSISFYFILFLSRVFLFLSPGSLPLRLVNAIAATLLLLLDFVSFHFAWKALFYVLLFSRSCLFFLHLLLTLQLSLSPELVFVYLVLFLRLARSTFLCGGWTFISESFNFLLF